MSLDPAIEHPTLFDLEAQQRPDLRLVPTSTIDQVNVDEVANALAAELITKRPGKDDNEENFYQRLRAETILGALGATGLGSDIDKETFAEMHRIAESRKLDRDERGDLFKKHGENTAFQIIDELASTSANAHYKEQGAHMRIATLILIDQVSNQ